MYSVPGMSANSHFSPADQLSFADQGNVCIHKHLLQWWVEFSINNVHDDQNLPINIGVKPTEKLANIIFPPQ